MIHSQLNHHRLYLQAENMSYLYYGLGLAFKMYLKQNQIRCTTAMTLNSVVHSNLSSHL